MRQDIDDALADGNVFVQHWDRYRFRFGEGFAMLALRTDDAQSDQTIFNGLGYSTGDIYAFERKAKGSDGVERTLV